MARSIIEGVAILAFMTAVLLAVSLRPDGGREPVSPDLKFAQALESQP